jgi:hypothetical protein
MSRKGNLGHIFELPPALAGEKLGIAIKKALAQKIIWLKPFLKIFHYSS